MSKDERWLSLADIAEHLGGSTDRLLTYPRGEQLTEAQRTHLGWERTLPEPRPTGPQLVDAWADPHRAGPRVQKRLSPESRL